MKEISTLLLLELRSFYGINKFLHTKDVKYKTGYKRNSIVCIFLICMMFTYIGGLVKGLCTLGLSDIVPAYLVTISSVLILILSLFTSGNRIFGQRGYDILASMPIKSSSIVISRFLGLYIADFVVTIVIMLPGVVVYGCCEKPNLLFYILSLIGTLFIPAIPLVISTLFGTLIMTISSRMKNKSMTQSLLSILFVIGVMLTSFSMASVVGDLTPEQFTDLAKTINGVFKQIYPPAIWLNTAMTEFKIAYLLLFIALSLGVILLAVFVVSRNFNTIIRRLSNFSAKHNYKIGKMANRSLIKALYFKEVKRYFSSSIYVTNTIIGPVMGTIMSVALCIIGIDTVTASLPLPINIAGIVPFAFSAIFCLMTTTAVSISMEGKQIWIVKSLPIPLKSLLDSKILLNLSLMLPFYVVSQIAIGIAVKLGIIELIWQLLIPALIMIFVTVFGITVNLKFHSFDWEKEETVVKQSLSSFLGGFSGFFISLVFGVLTLFIPNQFSNFFNAIICIIIITATVLLYKNNNRKNLIDL